MAAPNPHPATRPIESGPSIRQAHPPIHPTKLASAAERAGWPPAKRAVHEFIVRHFLACCSHPAQGRASVIRVEIGGEGFAAHGLMVTARNYLDGTEGAFFSRFALTLSPPKERCSSRFGRSIDRSIDRPRPC